MEETKKEVELEERIRQGSRDVNDYIELRNMYFESSQLDKLLRLCDEIKKLELSNLELGHVLYQEGEALRMLSRMEEAIASYRQSLRILGPEASCFEASYLRALNHYTLFLLSLDLSEKNLHARKALHYFSLIRKQAACYDDKYMILSRMTDIYSRLGEYQTALDFYKEILEMSSDDADTAWALNGIATIHTMRKDYARAKRYFKEALRKANRTRLTSKIYYDMAIMYIEAEELFEAKEAFQSALRYRDSDTELRDNREYEIDIFWHLGTIGYETNKEKEGAMYLERVLENIDDSHYYYTNVLLTLAHLYLKMKDYKTARDYYNSVISSRSATDEDIQIAEECLGRISFRS